MVLGERQHAVVILHDDGAFLALADGDFLGGGHHIFDGGVVLLEPRRFLIVDGDVAVGAQHAVDLVAVVFRQALAQAGQHKQDGHQRGKTPEQGNGFLGFHSMLHPFFDLFMK